MVRGVRLGPTRVRSHRVRLRGLYNQRVRTFGSRIIFATPLGRESIFSESALHRPMFLQITCAVPENGATDGAPIREVSQKTKKQHAWRKNRCDCRGFLVPTFVATSRAKRSKCFLLDVFVGNLVIYFWQLVCLLKAFFRYIVFRFCATPVDF